jgi:hypothetical protein
MVRLLAGLSDEGRDGICETLLALGCRLVCVGEREHSF